ncbi:hypothetical protein PPSIR1_40225 [Plesiocystis pacifica SIR-1]|uniref:Uncharacterized protein n=1 Tax=Plesiocystis pacifica SIR-1 TaxID=391625 RepID=A6FYH5_9BACT|nr:thrombospondin type 3 repeat-containing protein [Plesiocystis pacifica]EDM81247.1 hypothetical protein PPSIR1_40225 [Plesiocystis pacifica SIR-1]
MIVSAVPLTGCLSDSDCGVCDPNKLVLESITAVNYENRKVHRLTPDVSEGQYFIDSITDCLETEEALANPRGEDEYCKLSPLITGSGLEFVFNNLLEATSVELVRRDPSNPQLFEVYDWKSRIAAIEGPITRFNGDYVEQPGEDPDTVARAINLSCVENLRAMGQDFDHEVLDDDPLICEGFYTASDGRRLPLRMQESGETKSYAGETDWRVASCSAPSEGPDTCCSACDYELSVNVAKYGATASGGRRDPFAADANAQPIACDPTGDVYTECADFVASVDREFETNRYLYEWLGETREWRLPLSDKLRETHPALRPAGAEPVGAPCQTDADCDEALGGDAGAACIGTDPEGQLCAAETEGCADAHCKAEWFATCSSQADTTGGAFCVDRRFRERGAGGCYVATEEFQSCETDGTCTTWEAGRRLAYCDSGEFPNGVLAASECCQANLGAAEDGGACDPLFQPNLRPVQRFDRDQTLPAETRSCFCGDPSQQPDYCARQIEQFCTAPWGSLERHDGASNEDAYVTRFVTKVGGVVYDPALKGVLFLPGDLGNQPRSAVESCAEVTTTPSDMIGGRNPQDGWRMHDNAFFETYENFDRGMCSGSKYTVRFSSEGQFIRDKVGNVLSTDELSYAFETPEFHVVPDTGYPTDNLRIGACSDFGIRLSNKYDLSPNNTKKIELVQLSRVADPNATDEFGESCSTSNEPECWAEDFVVAGGPRCTLDKDEVVADQLGAGDDLSAVPPCLIVDVSGQNEGRLGVFLDNVNFLKQLFHFDEDDPSKNVDSWGRDVTGRYRLRVPGLEGVERFADLDLDDPEDRAAYDAAFHDVCGMPLITTGGQGYEDFYYDFTIDEPKCKEDPDGDGVELSCDNARQHTNPFQFDEDLDGYGDIVDKCQLTPGTTNTADSDRDGIGNDCDRCQSTADSYNIDGLAMDPAFMVRNIPDQTDTDRDGIGDVCDNCIWTPNCSVFGEDNPHTVGTPVPADSSVCQADENANMIGEACEDPDTNLGLQINAWAAGPIGFGNDDDFDQDGLSNVDDACPRQPVAPGEPISCASDTDCPTYSTCEDTGYCDHVDSDDDEVGDICDTCPAKSNPLQIVEGGAQEDDKDGDFIGADCEAGDTCRGARDPRPYAFMEVSVNGLCCTTQWPGDGAYGEQRPDGSWECEGPCDPDGFPIKADCEDEADLAFDVPDGIKCRSIPAPVLSVPGMVNLPEGCQEALDAAGLCDPGKDPNCPDDPDSTASNRRLRLDDVPDPDQLWDKMCWLPQWDQDFDGLGDTCDLCPFAFDPFNETFTSEATGVVIDNVGKYCAGEYSPDALCADQADDEAETETGTEGDTTEG